MDTELVEIEELVTRVQRDADRAALEELLRKLRPDVYQLALRFLGNPDDAEDSTQEILIRIVTHLGGFRGDSAFLTWVYRVSTNALLTARKNRMEKMGWTFEAFGRDLADGLSDTPCGAASDTALLLEEVKIGCTLGMLLCLDRAHRIAYILGEILELGHHEAAQILKISPPAFRKRLSRARRKIIDFTREHCGLINPENACRCSRRIDRAIELGRVNPENLQFAGNIKQARRFPAVLKKIRALEGTRRAAALYRSHRLPQGTDGFSHALKRLLQSNDLM